MNLTAQREHWDGHPVELGDAWTPRKGDKVTRCVLVSHQLGWELRLMGDDSEGLALNHTTKWPSQCSRWVSSSSRVASS